MYNSIPKKPRFNCAEEKARQVLLYYKVNPLPIDVRLLKLRLSEKKTQKEVTEAIGISVSALTMYETGNRIPRDEIKVKLAHYYSTSVERLFYA